MYKLILDLLIDDIVHHTGQPLYNTPCYNMGLDITQLCCGSQIGCKSLNKGFMYKLILDLIIDHRF